MAAALDLVRALAALGVLLFHYRAVRSPGDPAVEQLRASPLFDLIISHAYLGVDVFFALSGFLLVQGWARHAFAGAAPPDPRRFYRRRIRRIVPAYYAHLVFLFAVAAPLLLGVRFMAENPGLVAFNAAAHAMFLHYTTPLSAGSLGLNGALWTLALEAQFYLLLPWIAPRFVRHPAAWTVAAILLTTCWRWLAHHDLDAAVAWELARGERWAIPESTVRELLASQLPGYAAQFAVGMALGTAWARVPGRESHAARTAGSVARCLARGAALGSYSAYLWHLPVLLLWNRLRVLDGTWASLPAWLFVVALVAWLSYRGIERPFLARDSNPRPL